MQEEERRPARRADDDLVRRLDELSRDDAERVLERAFRLQAERHDVTTLSRGQLEAIADELGLDPSIVSRALDEEMAVPADPVAPPGWLGPRRISARREVAGSEAEVADHIVAWMENEEGLRPVARTGDGIRWERDTHWATATRLAFGSQGTKSLRGMPEIVHTQLSLGDDRQVVEIDVDTSRIRVAASVVGGSIAAAGALTGAIMASVTGEVGLVFAGAVPGVAVGAGSALVTARVWASSIAAGVSRALDGISHPELYRRRSGWWSRTRRQQTPRRGFEKLVDDVSDALDRLFD